MFKTPGCELGVDRGLCRVVGCEPVESILNEYTLEILLPSTTQAVSDGNWVFLKPLSVGKHVIYFKGGLKTINATATSGSNSNYTFAGPYGWDSPVTYHLTITKS